MLRKLNQKIKGQNTAEYAILIALVVAAAIGIQMYVKRGLQARIHRGSAWMANYIETQGGGDVGDSTQLQYEPYYLNSEYKVTRNQTAFGNLERNGEFRANIEASTLREAGGFQIFENVVQE